MSVSTSATSLAQAKPLSALFELTKPRIVLLVLFTGMPALLLAGEGLPSARVFWGALVGIALSAASGAAFNHYYDRDLDGLMIRTRNRPLPSGALTPAAAAALGLMLGWRQHRFLSAHNRVQARAVWELVVFVMEALVFILIGLALKGIIGNLGGPDASLWSAMLSR